MIQSAEDYAEAAGRLRELAEVRNHGEVLADEIELALEDYRDHIEASAALQITEQIAALRVALAGTAVGEMRTRTAALVQVAQVLRQEEDSGDDGML